MWHDPDAALARQHQREAARRRRRNRQREDLVAAARVLLPEHGLALALGRIAVHAGLTRHAAQALFNATTDLATELVRSALFALLEHMAPQPGAPPEQVLARLIAAIRADAPAHLIHAALACGAAGWQRAILTHAEGLLALTLTEALGHAAGPASLEAGQRLGHRVLALARAAALSPQCADVGAEAARLAAMLGRMAAPIAATAAPTRTRRRPAPPCRQPAEPPRPAADIRADAAPPASHTPPRVHDPPGRTA
jgi:hypothetical protein